MIPNMMNANPWTDWYNRLKSCCVTFFEGCIIYNLLNPWSFLSSCSILNKLTPEKFDKLCLELLNVGINSKVILKGIILLVSFQSWVRILTFNMHMTSQKGAPACWGSNEALSCAPSPSMQPAGQPFMPYRRAGPGPRTDWEAESANALPAQHVRTARQVLTPNMASLLWRRDVNA